METPAAEAARLLAALEHQLGQEEVYLRGGHYELMADSRRRSEPLVAKLAGLATQPGVDELRPRVEALQVRTRAYGAQLNEKIEERRAEIQRLTQARQRVGQLAPAYVSRSARIAPRFRAAG